MGVATTAPSRADRVGGDDRFALAVLAVVDVELPAAPVFHALDRRDLWQHLGDGARDLLGERGGLLVRWAGRDGHQHVDAALPAGLDDALELERVEQRA